jgi:TnsA endonuclease N terminal/TnsA endonuclease C terminal
MAKRDRSIRSSVTEQRIAEGRGKGIGASYNPWLHVQDVATDGRAWRIKNWKTGRDHHFLSDHEHNYYLIAYWSQKVVDIREQFPLPLETTLEIAKKIGIPHPADRRKNPVVMTTDFLVTVSTPTGNVDWARTIKPSSQLQKQRVIEKLEIERIYWQTNNISWGIVTEREMPMVLVKNIEYLYSHYEIADRVSLSQDEIYGIAETLTSLITQNSNSLKDATRLCDEKLGLQRGDSLTIARHLLATRQWLVDMNIPIEPGNQMALLAVSLEKPSVEVRDAV